jgi:endonuclease/exonuclease/phosphatase family metal-dependent hydrolase
MKKLSAQSKQYMPKKHVIVSWNLLSERLIEATENTIAQQHVSLFPQAFLKKRIDIVKQCIKKMVKEYRHPIFCFQEVNDDRDETKSLIHQIQRILQEEYYQVFTSSFGSFDTIYPELGLLTAIPAHVFDVNNSIITKITPESPNTFIALDISFKASKKIFSIVNTHFPAKFKNVSFMSNYTQQFREKLGYLVEPSNMIICGDFNTNPEDTWFRVLKHGLRHVPTDGLITTLSIQRRDRRSHKNMIYQGFLDHCLWGHNVNVEYVKPPPRRLTDAQFNELEQPTKTNPHIIPSEKIPSDHFPMIISFH